MADSLVARLEQAIAEWREEIEADKTKIQELKRQDEWEQEQALAFRYGRQVECADRLDALCRAWQEEQGWQPIETALPVPAPAENTATIETRMRELVVDVRQEADRWDDAVSSSKRPHQVASTMRSVADRVANHLDDCALVRADGRADVTLAPEVQAVCLDCGLLYQDFPLDTVLPDAQWLAIHPEGEGGLLCAGCIVKRVAKIPGIIVLAARFVLNEHHKSWTHWKNLSDVDAFGSEPAWAAATDEKVVGFHRDMALRLSEDRDVQKHRARAAETSLVQVQQERDDALASCDRAVARARELEDAIRAHRDAKADDRCIEDDDALYASLRDGITCDRRVGDKEAMLKNCARFIERRCEGGGWPTYAELEAERDALLARRKEKW